VLCSPTFTLFYISINPPALLAKKVVSV
jgi:hypothetical protein